MKLPRFTIRELALLILLVGTSLGWWIDHFRSDWPKWQSMNRSWVSGKVVVEHEFTNDRYAYNISGDWPDASPDLHLRGTLFMRSKNTEDLGITTVNKPLLEYPGSWGFGKTSAFTAKPEPTGFVFDYEIWDGMPGKGKLLTKQSVISMNRETDRLAPTAPGT